MTIQLINKGGRQFFNGSIIYAIDLDSFQQIFICTTKRKNGRKATAINITLNGCELLDDRRQNIFHISNIVWSQIKNTVQNLQRCPVKKVCYIMLKYKHILIINF